MENILFIKDEAQFAELFNQPKWREIRIKFFCKICGKEESLKLRNCSVEKGLICRRSHKPDKVEKTCKKCGKTFTIRRLLFEKKSECLCEYCTRIKNSGGEEAFHKKRLESAKKTCNTQLKKYGAIGNGNPSANEKRMKTIKEKYGNDFYKHVFSDAAKVRTPEERKISSDKRRQTMRDKYGREFNNRSVLYKVDDIYFDSSWEVYFYIYCKDKSIKIEREPLSLDYIGDDGAQHKYYPDFRIPCGLVEIKSEYKLQKEPKGKIFCIKSNKIVLISNKEIQFFKKYFESHYGKNKIKEFKC